MACSALGAAPRAPATVSRAVPHGIGKTDLGFLPRFCSHENALGQEPIRSEGKIQIRCCPGSWEGAASGMRYFFRGHKAPKVLSVSLKQDRTSLRAPGDNSRSCKPESELVTPRLGFGYYSPWKIILQSNVSNSITSNFKLRIPN